MSKTFNIYCDESCHIEHDHKPFMFLGSVRSPYNQVKLHTQKIKELKEKHNFYAEIKWTSVSNSKLDFYLDLVDYFFKTELNFRVVGVEKAKIDAKKHGKSYDEFYYTMYYYLLKYNINKENNYNAYIDIKDTLSAYRLVKLQNILNAKKLVFRRVQNIHSHESLLMQLADFLMGAISYLHNDEAKQNEAKVRIIDRIKVLSNEKLCQTNYNQKLNLFFIELQ